MVVVSRPPRYVRPPSFRLIGVADGDAAGGDSTVPPVTARELDDFAVVGPPEEEELMVVWLGHRRADGSGIRTGTLGRRATDAKSRAAYGAEDGLRLTAWLATDFMVYLTLPALDAMASEDRVDGLGMQVRAHARRQAQTYQSWPGVDLAVDDAPVPAACWAFGGAWAAVATLGDVYLAVIGTGVSPTGLRLATVTDTDPYDVDLTRPLDRERARDRPDLRDRTLQTTLLRPVNPARFHPDHLGLT